MSKKHRTTGGIMYSTNPEQPLDGLTKQSALNSQANPLKQNLRISLDKKQRAGKAVTLVSGYAGNPDILEELGRFLKSKCGVGGSCKDGLIIIQGDFRQKVAEILQNEGYKAKVI